MRIALGLQYDGSRFYGWQRQENLRTVQTAVEEALSKVANDHIAVTCAGRTDVGVHAHAQVIHFDTHVDRDDRAWILGTNSYLPDDISVKWMRLLDEDFHARFSALQRHYRYIIYNCPTRPSLYRHTVTWICQSLDESKMSAALPYLLGEHDFSSFRDADCQAHSARRRIDLMEIRREGDFIIFDIAANAFLHHMIRNIMGVLLLIGLRKRAPAWAKTVLEARDRRTAGITASATGLYLTGILYPEEFNLPVPTCKNVFPLFL